MELSFLDLKSLVNLAQQPQRLQKSPSRHQRRPHRQLVPVKPKFLVRPTIPIQQMRAVYTPLANSATPRPALQVPNPIALR